MKNIKSYKLFEAIIIPKESDSIGSIYSYDDLVRYSNENDFDVVEYDDFYDSLSDKDKKTVPPKITPFFALFHPVKKKPMFVIKDLNIPRMFPNFKEIVSNIIGHEKIHSEQNRRMSINNIDYVLPNPLDRNKYFSNKEEVMAFSYSIAKELIRYSKIRRINDLLESLPKYLKYSMTFTEVKINVDSKTLNRYKKYIYLYIEKLLE